MTETICAIDDCGRKTLARGWCSRHYQSWLKRGDPLATTKAPRPETCVIKGCGGIANEPGSARDWCRKHYLRWQKHGDPEVTAACAGCGAPISVGWASYCRRRECRRIYRAAERAKDPEKARAAQARQRDRADPAKRRAAVARYRARVDRACVRPGCTEFALKGLAYCRPHAQENSARRYARIKLRLPRRLYERQRGLCPSPDFGGCGLPLWSVDGHHVDHLIPIARNGPDDDWNLQLMHPECNLAKADRLVLAAQTAAGEHDVVLTEPGSRRLRLKPACLLP